MTPHLKVPLDFRLTWAAMPWYNKIHLASFMHKIMQSLCKLLSVLSRNRLETKRNRLQRDFAIFFLFQDFQSGIMTTPLGEKNTNAEPKLRKQDLVLQQKQEAARQIREEKERLKAEKKRKHDDFLRETAEKRERLEIQLEAKRLATKHQQNADQAQKELEIANRKWTLEQERLHRMERTEAERKQRRHEEEIKTRERHDKMSAKARKKSERDAERKRLQLKVAEDLEHRRLVKDLERMEMKEEFDKQYRAREEARLREKSQEEEADQKARESRNLDEAAYQDVQSYLKSEREARRQSTIFRLKEAKKWKQKHSQQENLNQILERQDRELQIAAYNDMKRYLNSEKESRRQSLQEFLKNESEHRRLAALEAEEKREEEERSRALDEAAYKDAKRYEQSLVEQRRLSIVNRLAQDSELKTEEMSRQKILRKVQEESLELDRKADEDARRYIEDERRREKDMSMKQARDELEAAMELERKVEAELEKINSIKKKDIDDYSAEIADKYFAKNAVSQVQVILDQESQLQNNQEDEVPREDCEDEDTPLPPPPQFVSSIPQPTVSTTAPSKPRKTTKFPKAGGCCIIS